MRSACLLLCLLASCTAPQSAGLALRRHEAAVTRAEPLYASGRMSWAEFSALCRAREEARANLYATRRPVPSPSPDLILNRLLIEAEVSKLPSHASQHPQNCHR